MDSILETIDRALERKGLTDAAASRMAVGHPSLLKNMRMPRDGEKRYNLPALQRLAEVLDLEFYFGPRRPRSAGFDEAGADGTATILAPPTGYVTFVWDQIGLSGVPPIAFSQAWIVRHGLDQERHTCVAVGAPPTDAASPTVLAVIDRDAPRSGGPDVWALRHPGRTVELAQVQFEGTLGIILPDRPNSPAVLVRPNLPGPQFLGRVLWRGQLSSTKIERGASSS